MKALSTALFLICLMATSMAFGQQLVGYWELNGGGEDISGFGNHGTVFGATPTTGRFGCENSALFFDGVDDYIDCGSHASVDIAGDQLTISAWFKTSFDATPTFEFPTIVGKGTVWLDGATSFNTSYTLRINTDNEIHGYIANADNQLANVPSGSMVNDGLWHHAVVVYNGSLVDLHIDGILVNSTPQNGMIESIETQLSIGAGINNGSGYDHVPNYFFHGSIDEVRLYNYALTQTEIDHLATSGDCGSICEGNIYSEDFTSDPQFTSNYFLQSGEFLEWNPIAGTFDARLNEQPNDYKYAYSPLLPLVENRSFSFTADVSLIGMSGAIWIGVGWGDPAEDYTTYGGIYTHGMSNSTLYWTITDANGNEYPAGSYMTPGVWYTFSLDYDHDLGVASFSIINRETDDVYYSEDNVPFNPHGFERVWIGTRTYNADGQYVEMQSDNICVSTMDNHKTVAFDIKPGSCPNPLNVKMPGQDWIWLGGSEDEFGDPEEIINDTYSKLRPESMRFKKSVLPVAILGTAEFDVSQIDLGTISLLGLAPLRSSYEDVGTPISADAAECECNDFGPDGFVDLTLKFGRAEIITALGAVFDGDMISLTISGQLLDGTEFEGVDCVLIRGDQPASMVITDLPITNTQLVGNAPNPFNPMTTISFNMATEGRVNLSVYNITGQKVKTLLNETFQTGLHNVVWDGRDESGRSAASGIYFYRIETADFTESKRMVLLK